MTHTDGTQTWMQFTGMPAKGTDDISVCRIVVTDIAHRRRGVERAQRQEQLFKLFVEHSPASIAMFDRDMKYIIASRRFLLDYGIAESDVTGRSHYEIFPEISERWRLIHRRCLAGETVKADEDIFPRADGTVDWVRWEIHPWYERPDEIGGIILFSEVITERKNAEDALKLNEALLRTTQRLTRSGGWEWNVDQRTMFWTEETYRLHDFDPGEFTYGSPDLATRSLECYLPAYRPFVKAAFERCAAEGVPYDLECVFVSAKRRRMWVRTFAEPVWENGRVTRVIGMIIDITDRKAAEQRSLEKQRRDTIGTLSGGIAHDYNNLLGIMMGNSSLALEELHDAHPARGFVKKSMIAMERAAELTRQILAYAGKGKYRSQLVDLAGEVRKHVALLKISLAKNVKLALHLPASPLFVNGDPSQIEQVIMNLLINGGEAIGEQQGEVSITLSEITLGNGELAAYAMIPNTTLSEGRYVLIEVHDTGAGMDPAIIGKIFDPFFTTKFTGRGMGLSAVLGIVQGHKGGITVDSGSEEGTTFRIVLPAAGTLAPGSEPPSGGTRHQSPAASTVLVIDDEQDVAAMAQDILTAGKYATLVALDPVKGIEVFREHRSEILLVFLDLTMPEMPGKDVVEALRAIDPDVKILITSGYSEEEVVKKIGDAKVSAFIQKPYRMKSLLSIVETVLS